MIFSYRGEPSSGLILTLDHLTSVEQIRNIKLAAISRVMVRTICQAGPRVCLIEGLNKFRESRSLNLDKVLSGVLLKNLS